MQMKKSFAAELEIAKLSPAALSLSLWIVWVECKAIALSVRKSEKEKSYWELWVSVGSEWLSFVIEMRN
jgi:hypothetical protein